MVHSLSLEISEFKAGKNTSHYTATAPKKLSFTEKKNLSSAMIINRPDTFNSILKIKRTLDYSIFIIII